MHHDNVPCHTAISINQFLTTKIIPVTFHLKTLLVLSPCDFFLFPRLKIHLKEHFRTLKNIKIYVADELKSIIVTKFQNCYEQW
jgi:hypothetical protein